MKDGGQAVDKRGVLTYFNDFNFDDVKRFYIVENHELRTIRAWHGHEKEAKYVYVIQGVARIIALDLDTEKVALDVVLSGRKPQILYIPPLMYNGAMNLVPNTKIIYFSTATLEESKGDDFRLPDDKYKELWS